jgi:hypothetical protein
VRQQSRSSVLHDLGLRRSPNSIRLLLIVILRLSKCPIAAVPCASTVTRDNAKMICGARS